MRHRRSMLLAATFALAGAGLLGSPASAEGAAASTVTPAGPATNQWAWVVSRRLAEPTFAPGTLDQGNALGGSNTVTWTSKGRYEVVLPGFGGTTGVALVSPLSSDARRCRIEGTFTDGSALLVTLVCYTAVGFRADSRFALVYVANGPTSPVSPPTHAYLLADQPASTSGYIPTGHTSRTGGTLSVERIRTGVYRLGFNGVGSPGGNVQITPVGAGVATCSADWGSVDPGQMFVFVTCRGASGAPLDWPFVATLTDRAGLKGLESTGVAYLHADRPRAADYAPTAARRFSSPAGRIRIVRTGTGRYRVTLAGMPRGGAVVVTPSGDRDRLCTIGAIRKGRTPKQIAVRCFDRDGALRDATFSLSFLR